MIDYGYRAVHEMTVAAKAITAAFYGTAPARSYWNGCSTGGRQGLMEAWRYPADYDGIIAGAPVNHRTRQLTAELWVAHAVHASEASYIPPAKYPAIHRAAVEACDGNDGLKDGLIDDPRQCRFDPQALQCTGADGDVVPDGAAGRPPRGRSIRRRLAPASKKEIFPALQRGGELVWDALAGPRPITEAVEFFQYVVLNDPAWDFKTLSFDTAAELADKAAGDVLNVIDPNLKPFFDRGGKLLLYHGWNDQFVSPINSINYYTEHPRRAGDQGQAGRLDPAVHGAGDEPLPRRRRAEHVRRDRHARSLGREGARHRTASTRRTPPAARSIAPAHCAPIRRWRVTTAPAASTTPRTSHAARPGEDGPQAAQAPSIAGAARPG